VHVFKTVLQHRKNRNYSVQKVYMIECAYFMLDMTSRAPAISLYNTHTRWISNFIIIKHCNTRKALLTQRGMSNSSACLKAQ